MPSVLLYAARQLLKSPGFTLVAILSLALGIGANVALFSVVNSVLLRPLPFDEPDRLVRLSSTSEETNLTRVGFSYPRFLEVQQRHEVFSALALSAGNAFTMTGRGDPEQLIGLQASAALLPALGLEPVLGRSFSAGEDRQGGEHVALISHAMWQQRFNRDPSVIGQALTLDGARLALLLLAGFAALALVLASLGVYSVMAHLVAFRTSEIGLRIALGATPGAVMRMVLGHGRRLTLVGVAFGIAGALVVSRLMQQAPFEVDPADPLVYIAVSVTLLVAEAASFFPARRAMRIDPMIALRTE